MILVFLLSLRSLAMVIDTAWPSRNSVRFDVMVRMVIRTAGIRLSRFELASGH